MKKITGMLFGVIVTCFVYAQTPNGFKYQAVLRNTDGTIKANESISLEIDILKSSATGVGIYSESHSVTTNTYGLVSLVVGDGTSSDDFTSIDWSSDEYFIKISVGGTEFGTSQLMSVPYALHAKTAEKITGSVEEDDPIFSSSIAANITGSDTSMWNNKLDAYTELDPIFSLSAASDITDADIMSWNSKPDNLIETDPVYELSIAAHISALDTSEWNNKLDSYTEFDPIYNTSVASKISALDTANWNNKQNCIIAGSGIVKSGDTVSVKDNNVFQPWDTTTSQNSISFKNQVVIGDPDNVTVPPLKVYGTDSGPTSASMKLLRSSYRNNVIGFETTDLGYQSTLGVIDVGRGLFFGIGMNDGFGWTNPIKVEFGASDKSIYIDNAGHIGLGTEEPQRAVHINDVLRIEPRSSAPTSPAEGDIYMDASTHKLMVFDGTIWQSCW